MQCLSVAAASVIAKVERDQQMRELHAEFPDFGWDINKGYATALHRDVAPRRRAHARTTGSAGGCWAANSDAGCRLRRPLAPVARGGCQMVQDGSMSAEDLENYETDMELQLYREYRDVVGLFSYVVETERRFYLANHVDLQARSADGEVYFDLTLQDAWVWDVYRSARFVKSVRVLTFKDVNVEELPRNEELALPKDVDLGN